MTDVPPTRLVDAPAPRMGARRRAVLARLRDAAGAGEPGTGDELVSVDEVAAATGLHPNTARFHLDGLVQDGLAERSAERRSTPGRRRVLYAARPERAGERSYGLLAQMLTGMVAGLEGARDAAVETGRGWGRVLARDRKPAGPAVPGPEAAVEQLRQVFDEVGFDPEVQAVADGTEPGVTEIHLRHCPFVEVARQHTEVVCSIHLGLMKGVLDEAGGAVEAESLHPFVAPGLCVARVRAQEADETRPIRTRQTSGPSSR